MNLTTEQRLAIDTSAKNLLVSASAGSGKTFVLVQRILKLIIDEQTPIDQFLIVTFTNAAAAEMRHRIAKALASSLAEYPDKRAFIATQIQRLHRSHISTLHAFCKTVLCDNYYHIGLDPNCRVGTQQGLEITFKRALDDVLEQHYNQNTAGFNMLLSYFSGHRGDDKLREQLRQIYMFSRAHPYPEQWLDQCIINPNTPEQINPLITAVIQTALNELTQCQQQLQFALELCEGAGGPSDYRPTIESDLAQLSAIDQQANQTTFDALASQLKALNFATLARIKKINKADVDPQIQLIVKEIRSDVKTTISKLVDAYFRLSLSQQLSDMAMMSQPLHSLIALVKALAVHYSNLKLADNLLDFNDLEQYAIAALNIEEVADYYRAKFSYVFVDEYQDSNRVQEEIVRLLKRHNNLFLVGDVKQSIYKFRMAEPQLFIEKQQRYRQDANSLRVDLNNNFRTHPDILDGINTVFNSLLQSGFGDINYRSDGQLSSLRSDFAGLAKPIITIGCRTDEPNALSKDQFESQLVVQRIKAITKQTFYDTASGQTRYYKLSDIVVLMRSVKGHATRLRDDLAKYAIPVVIDEEDNYFELLEVATLINCLRIIDNIRQDVPLLSVLRSFIGGFNDAELAMVRSDIKESYYEALTHYAVTGENATLKQKINDFLMRIANYRAHTDMPMSAYIWWLLTETGYYYYVLGLEDGTKRVQHLKMLAERAEQFEADGQTGIHHFVDYLDLLSRAKINYGGKASAAAVTDAITVMSIHKSKGLEFPVVILAGSERRFNLSDLKGAVVLHQELGLVSKWIDPGRYVYRDTLSYAHLKRVLKAELLQEEARILYVALTRPVYHLEVIGIVKNIDKQLLKWQLPISGSGLLRASSALDWLMPIISQAQVHGENSWQIEQIDELDLTLARAQIDEHKQHAILRNFERVGNISIEPFDGHHSDMPAKISVTALKQMDSTSQFIMPKTELLDRFSDDDQALLKGNIYHMIFEHINCDDQYATQVLKRLTNRGLIDDAAIQLIDPSAIQNYLDSALYRRICKAEHRWHEHPFVYQLTLPSGDQTLVQGVIDLLILEDNQLTVIDFKSDHVKRLDELVKRYHRQLGLYAQAVSALLNLPIKQKIIYSIALSCACEV